MSTQIHPEKPSERSHTVFKYFIELGSEQFEVHISRNNTDDIVVHRGTRNRSFRVVNKGDPNELMIVQGRRSFPVFIERTDGSLSVYYGCREAKTTVKTERDLLFEKYRTAAGQADAEIKIISPLPGLITKVESEPGTALKKGDGIVIIEAMKMENEIRAPRDCMIIELNVKAGQTIDKGHVIAVLE